MRSGFLPALALPLILGACTSDSTPAPASAGPVTLDIVELRPNGDSHWAPPRAPDPSAAGAPGDPGDPEPIVLGCDQRLGVTVAIDNFYLRAPDACGGTIQCGYLALDLYSASDSELFTPEASARGAALTLLLDLGKLDFSAPSDHTLVPSLKRPDGSPFKGPFANDPVPLAISLTTEASCAPIAAGGAGGVANEPSGAGTGGAPSP